MSWHEKNGPWQRAVRKLRRQFVFAMIAGVAFIAVPVLLRVYGPEMLRPIMLPWLFFGVFYILLILFQGRRVWRFWVASPRIPDADGHLCPRCTTDLGPADEVTACPKCGRRYTSDWLREFWTQSILAPMTTIETRWVEENRRWARRLVGSGLDERQYRRRVWIGGVLVAIGILFLAIALNSTAHIAWRIAFIAAGGVLHTVAAILTRAVWARAEAWASCPKCGYRYESGAGDACPECGAAWAGTGGTYRRARTMSWKRRFLIPLAVGMVAMLVVIGPKYFVNYAPTSWLIDRLARQSFAWREQRELLSRTLTSQEQEAFIIAMMDAAERFDTNIYAYQIDSMLSAQGVGDATRARFCDSMYTLSLERRGNEVMVMQLSTAPMNVANGMFAIFGGWEVDGESDGGNGNETRRDRSTTLAPAGSATGSPTASPAPWSGRLVPGSETAGVRASVWLIYGPLTLGAGAVTWNDDGTPVIPPSATWSKRVDLAVE